MGTEDVCVNIYSFDVDLTRRRDGEKRSACSKMNVKALNFLILFFLVVMLLNNKLWEMFAKNTAKTRTTSQSQPPHRPHWQAKSDDEASGGNGFINTSDGLRYDDQRFSSAIPRCLKETKCCAKKAGDR